MYNVERGTKLEYKPSIHGHSKSHIHNTAKVIWVNNNATQKMSQFTRRELMTKKDNGDTTAEDEVRRLHLLKLLMNKVKKQPTRLINLVHDFLDGSIDKDVVSKISKRDCNYPHKHQLVIR
jgi:hypothetical protein